MRSKRRKLRVAREWTSFDEGNSNVLVKRWMLSRDRIEDVPGEPAVSSADLDEIESPVARPSEHIPHFGKLHGNQLAEKRTDVDAREVIAVLPRTSGTRRVVTVLPVIEREFHEFRDRNRAVLADAGEDFFVKR